MIDDIDRRTLMGADKEDAGDRRQPLFWLLWALLIFFVLFGCGQIAMWFDAGGLEDVEVRSGLTVDYGIWTPVAFGGINPLIIAEAAGDNGGGIFLASNPSDSCFLLGDCTPNPPTPTPTPGPSATPTLTPTSTPTPTNTPTVTGTLPPTFTYTPVYTPTNTPTPTPLVWPLKVVNPPNVDPVGDLVTVNIIVVNYGNPTGASLTEIIDRMPPEMTFQPGSCSLLPIGVPAVPCTLTGNTLTWSFLPPWNIPQDQYVLASFRATVSGLSPGDIITNEAETSGGNFDTSTYIRRIYAYTPTPNPPVVLNDLATTNEDTSVNINVLSNDSNLIDMPISVLVSSAPTNGSASVVGSPGLPSNIWITYTPTNDYFGPDSFQYQVCDGSLPPDCDIATVFITVNSLNDVPKAQDDNVSTNEDTAIVIQVLGDNGSGPDVNFDYPLTIDVIGVPSNGVVNPLTRTDPAWPPAANFTYTPNLNWYGTDSFTYQITDVDLQTSSAQVTITVNPRNDIPSAVDDNGYVVIEDQSIDTLTEPGLPPPNRSVLTNDSDIDCTFPVMDCNPQLVGINPLTVLPPLFPLSRATTAGGSVQIRSDGTFVYTPRANFFGQDTFTYWAYDGLSTDPAVVRITVQPDPADIPAANPDTFTVVEDTPTQLDVLFNDTGWFDIPITLEWTDPPFGTAAIQYIDSSVIPPVIRILYTPDSNYYSPPGVPDSFTYCVRDNDDQPNNPCQPADFVNVDVTVTSVHDPPLAQDDAGSVNEDPVAPLDVEVLGNDILGDAAIDSGTVCIVGEACPALVFPISIANGRIMAITVIDPFTTEISYRPDDDFNGLTSFQYTVADTTGARSNAATVSINVTPVDDFPVAMDDDAHTVVGTTIWIDVLANDTGIGDTPLTLTAEAPIPDPLTEGTCTVAGTQIRFNPSPLFSGTVQCGYSITDFDGDPSNIAIINIYVNSIPVAVDDVVPPPPINEDDLIFIDILANDSDPDPSPPDGIDPTSVNITNSPDHAVVFSVNPFSGVVTYQPDPGYHGTDYFEYEVDDLHSPPATSNIARVDITITEVNNNPDAVDDTAFTQEDEAINIDVLANDDDPLDSPPDPLILTITSFVDPGTVTSTTSIDDNGSPNPDDDTLLYTPDPLEWGTETLTYTICDPGVDGIPGNGDDLCDSAFVNITVNGWPTAVDDDATAPQDTTIEIFVFNANPLLPDSDPDSPPISWQVTSVTDPPNGIAAINPSTSVFYTPDTGYISPPGSPDSFSYTMIDGDGGTSSATVYVTVLDTDSSPTASDDPGLGFPAIVVNEGQTVSINVLTNDTGLGDEPLTVTTSNLSFPACVPSDGSLSVNGSPGPASGISIDYTAPTSDCAGTVTFDYTVTDGDTGLYLPPESDTATVTITVNAVNDPPLANPDSGSTIEETSTSPPIDVASNDTDEETAVVPATVAIASCPGGATCTPNGDGTVTYTPAVDFFGFATFTYTIQDTLGATSAPGTVTIDVTNVNDPPNAGPTSANADQGQTININITPFVSDPDGNGEIDWSSLIITSGTCSHLGGGVLEFTAPVGPNLSHTCTYQVSDIYGAFDAGSSSSVTINITRPVLQVSKDFSTGSALPGDSVGFSITIFNLGPGTAFNVTISDTLGACFTWGSNPSGSAGSGTITNGGAAIEFGSVNVPNPLPPGCVDGENFNRADVTSSNTLAYSSTDTLSLPFGGGPPLAPMMMSMSVDTPTPTATPTETPDPSLLSSLMAPMMMGMGLETPTPTPTATPTATPPVVMLGMAGGSMMSMSVDTPTPTETPVIAPMMLGLSSAPLSTPTMTPTPPAPSIMGLNNVLSIPPQDTPTPTPAALDPTSDPGGGLVTPTAIVQVGPIPSSTSTIVPPIEIVGTPVAPTETAIIPSIPSETLPVPTETPPGPAPTETPSGPAPTETPSGPAPTETPSGSAPTETPSGSAPTETPSGPAPTETPPVPAPTETPAGPMPTAMEAGASPPAATPVIVPTPTPVAGAPTSTEATFTLLIPLTMMIGPFIYAWYQRIRFARRSSS